MTTTINASPTNGLVQTADGSGVLKVQSNGVTTNALAWVNFNGTGTVAIRSSYNVSSITDNGTGNYTLNYTTALSDANYAVVMGINRTSGANTDSGTAPGYTSPTTSTVTVFTKNGSDAVTDYFGVSVAIFGN